VAFDLLGYEASVQEAITTPWAKSFAMEITCSDSAMTTVKNGDFKGEKIWETHDKPRDFEVSP
jgi:hypothetical protein